MYYFVVFFGGYEVYILGLYTRFICTVVYMIRCSLSSTPPPPPPPPIPPLRNSYLGVFGEWTSSDFGDSFTYNCDKSTCYVGFQLNIYMLSSKDTCEVHPE